MISLVSLDGVNSFIISAVIIRSFMNCSFSL